ncbi:hypothetical protein [Cellulomonas soli]|uniref:Uncharacterized protein n=1 Tax=Cellulomonas soli TaxID=931535 RepID=A0A512PGI9_9CELL|nr:hypothetical protein [Cellulomonas soli]NYI58138.1 hypothetical protein [Cellulomonas soli]GEP70272.1 hypothetical protein CSO01_29870 [Cellulomonas soli]
MSTSDAPPPTPSTPSTPVRSEGAPPDASPADSSGTSPSPAVPRPAAPPAASPDAATPAPKVPAPPTGAHRDPASQVPDAELFPAPNAPFTTTFGTHVLGAVLGLLLAPIGMGVTLLGQSRILVAQVDGWTASADLAGIVLVTIGLLLLGTVLVLALWTPALPTAGGLLLTVAGGVYLYAPWFARERTLVVLPSEHWHVTLTQVTVAGTSGTVLVTGFLLLVAGLVAIAARRQGIHLGVFRERHHPGRATLPPPRSPRPPTTPPTTATTPPTTTTPPAG